MKLNELKPVPGSKKKKLIVGRGIGSGKGKTCGVGQKGQKSRSGVAIKGFEGGQMPLYQRLPKFGFNNTKFTKNYAEVTLGKLAEAIESKKIDAKKDITAEYLAEAGVISRVKDGLKVIGNDAIKAKLTVKAVKVTKGAQASIEKAGGSVELIVKEVAPIKNGKTSKKA
tara:strand:- start:11199 stop:11705 length:507 start_codon:yes stop_codon:yes gene_type:complete